MASKRQDPIRKAKPSRAVASDAPRLKKNAAPDSFQSVFFSRAAAEDIQTIDSSMRVALASIAYAHLLQAHTSAQTDIALTPVSGLVSGRLRDFTVITILNDNMPFLLDSTLAEIAERGLEPLLVIHPILGIERDKKGVFGKFAGDASVAAQQGARRESLIQILVDRIENEATHKAILAGLQKVYTDVRLAVHDWAAMRGQLSAAVMAYRTNPPPLPHEEVREAIAFLDWINNDNFTLLGMRHYTYPDGDSASTPVDGSGLGIMRDAAVRVLRRGRDLVTVTPEIRAFLAKPVALIITKANVKSHVHRRVHLDYIGVKLFSSDGTLEGELRVVGLFSSQAYTSSPADIPYLRRKISETQTRMGYDPASHSGRALMNVIESFPRDELFQIDADTLHRYSSDILALYERPRIRALTRADTFDRYVSALIYIPKDRYDTAVRRRVGEYLARIYNGRLSASYPAYPEGPLSRTHYIIGRDEGATPVLTRADIEAGIAAIVRTWPDALKDRLSERGAEGRQLSARYADGFSASYRDAFGVDDAMRDIALIETLSVDHPRAVDLYRRPGGDANRTSLKVYTRGAAIPLSERVPVLEKMGFSVINERTYHITPADGSDAVGVWLHDMTLELPDTKHESIDSFDENVEDGLLAVFSGRAESDGFNKLIVAADMTWREAALMRTFGRYLQQTGIPYGQDYLSEALTRYPHITRALLAMFNARFNPESVKSKAGMAAEKTDLADIETHLSSVSNLDDDRIIRRFINLITSAIRTTFYQKEVDGSPRHVIACKFEAQKLDGLPLPRPLFEIFVYSPRVEGIHLRFGKVARGGLRWSDRPQDFRTEILSLVKAQQVKNAVIVPVGAKGGFVPKKLPPPGNRQAWMDEGIAAYKIFITTLLQLTDNIIDGKIKPPADTVRHDADDPYLVVAADKGTATFSDIANSISLAMNHWLGDAFASGGSAGYDHKKMGITARGAWEAVKRHFREMNTDIQIIPITVAGVGDMSGDVFGNGVLLSKALKVVAAFDHRDIFIDPSPDPEKSWAERKRLFDLPRSSWQDYDKALISKGGGIYPRSSKSISLSPEARSVIGFDRAACTPAELMNAILKAPVDLLWFGGIGTYVRATTETDAQAGDRANDAIRITGPDLRCRVAGEGANLGMTQLGRIEAAQNGVRLNTDAIDNSAGVNTSDVEVNIKIALSKPEQQGKLPKSKREAFLASMTDDVASLVLRNNYLQTLALSLSEKRGSDDIAYIKNLMRTLEAQGRLNRSVEYLPTDAALDGRARNGKGVTRPELAVLLAYAKLTLFDDLIGSTVPDDPYLARELERYFPKKMRDSYGDAIATHRLRREIVATQLGNAIINRCGPTVVTRLSDETGRSVSDIASAYALTRDSFGFLDLNNMIDTLDTKVPGAVQNNLYARVQDAILARMAWFLRRTDFKAGLGTLVERYRKAIDAVSRNPGDLYSADSLKQRDAAIAQLTIGGVPPELAARITDLPMLAAVPDAVAVSQRTKANDRDAAATMLRLSDMIAVAPLKVAAETIRTADHYERLAVMRARDAIDAVIADLAVEVIASHGAGAKGVSAWATARADDLKRTQKSLVELSAGDMTQAKLSLAASLLRDLVR
ncbi:MAG: NAD-glutamate dehydrogenase [Beijerinckiaceae bacterium]